MKTIKINPEVFFVDGEIAALGMNDLDFLVDAATASPRHRARVCAHQDPEEVLHEMLVVMTRESYLIPEKHFVKVESYHIIQGQADVVIFDDAGEIVDVIEIGDAASGKRFFFRVRKSDFYHSLVIRTDLLVYHESATGPFRKADTFVAPWAPPEADEPSKLAFMSALERRVDAFQAARRTVSV
jgi:cupin fold WbuC family metalloprotein